MSLQGGSYLDCGKRSWFDFFMGRQGECLVIQGGGPENPDFGKHPQAQEVMMGGSQETLSGGAKKSSNKKSRKSPKRKPVRKSPVRKSPVRKIPVRKSPLRKSPVRKSPVRKSPVRKSPRPARGCTLQMTKKYQTRKSPPQPANECCNSIKVGNDGSLQKSSRVGAQSACTWKSI